MAQTKVRLVCAWCSKKFVRIAAEYARNKSKVFCSKRCSIRNSNRVRAPNPVWNKNLNAANKRDELTPFRWFMARVRYRQKDTDLTVEYLKQIWDEQKGICPLTGWNLVLPTSTRGWELALPENASLDKIVSKPGRGQGYFKGNVRFTSVMANYAKSTWTDGHLLDFCRAVVKNHS